MQARMLIVSALLFLYFFGSSNLECILLKHANGARVVKPFPCSKEGNAEPPLLHNLKWAKTNASSRIHLIEGRSPLSLPVQSVRHCLSGRRLAFLGDSLTRFQYLSLVRFLAHDEWDGAIPYFKVHAWPSWEAYLRAVNVDLHTNTTRETCDCARGLRDDDVENHYFEDVEKNISVAFFFMRTGYASFGHDTTWLNVNCKGRNCQQTGCEPGECVGSSSHWRKDVPRALAEHVALTFRPDTMVLNGGIWGSMATPETILQLEALTYSLRKFGVRDLLWKTTTACLIGRCADGISGDGTHVAILEYSRIVPTLLQPAAPDGLPWRIFDAFAITEPLVKAAKNGEGGLNLEDIFYDGMHFFAGVYEGLNELFLLDYMRGCSMCTGQW